MKISPRNMPLLIVLLLTCTISFVLIYLVIIKHADVSETNTKIEQYKKILEDANKKKPAPVTENFKNMTNDAERLNMKTYQIQHNFGKYYRKALIQFANTVGLPKKKMKESFQQYYQNLSDDLRSDIVGTTDKKQLDDFLSETDKTRFDAALANYTSYINESTILKNFAAYYKELPKEKQGLITGGNQDKVILQNFFKQEKYDPAALKQATQQFIQDIQNITVERVNEGNVHEFILAALGLPRTAFVTYYKGMLKNLQNLIFTKKVLPQAETIKAVESLTFGEDFQPNQKQIPQVIRQMMLREDIFKRAKGSDLMELESIKELTPPLIGKKVNDEFLKFTYLITVTGTMDQLRSFINSLHNAYKDNIIYIITDMALERANAENIADLTAAETKDQSITLASKFQLPDFEAQNTEKNLLAASYGKPIIGRTKTIRMDITLDVFLYVADQLERVDLSSK